MGKWKKPYGQEHRWNRKALIKRDGTKCQLCGLEMVMKDITVDHILPVSEGGSDKLENLRLVHGACNQARGTSMREWKPETDVHATDQDK